jgi:hypothetical protein
LTRTITRVTTFRCIYFFPVDKEWKPDTLVTTTPSYENDFVFTNPSAFFGEVCYS